MSAHATVLGESVSTSNGPEGGGRGPGRTAHRTEQPARTILKRRVFPDVGKPAKRRRWKSLPGKHRRLKSNGKWKRGAASSNNSAPFNSTQFLMSDHGGETIQYLDSTLGVKQSRPSSEKGEGSTVPARRVKRGRESSFSLDSDEDFYYSSPEDEEEFVSREFIKEYNNVRTDRLVDMSKADLIQEYLQMEQRVDSLEKRLKRHNGKEEANEANDETDSNSSDSKEVTEQIRLFQKEILRLEAENERLRSDNILLVQHKKLIAEGDGGGDEDDSASSCSSCSSSCSSCSSSSSSDDGQPSDDEEQKQEARAVASPATTSSAITSTGGDAKGVDVNERDDTGYESSHSGTNAKMKCVLKGEHVVSSTSTN